MYNGRAPVFVFAEFLTSQQILLFSVLWYLWCMHWLSAILQSQESKSVKSVHMLSLSRVQLESIIETVLWRKNLWLIELPWNIGFLRSPSMLCGYLGLAQISIRIHVWVWNTWLIWYHILQCQYWCPLNICTHTHCHIPWYHLYTLGQFKDTFSTITHRVSKI